MTNTAPTTNLTETADPEATYRAHALAQMAEYAAQAAAEGEEA